MSDYPIASNEGCAWFSATFTTACTKHFVSRRPIDDAPPPNPRVLSLYGEYRRKRPQLARDDFYDWLDGPSLQPDNEMVRTISGRDRVFRGRVTHELLAEAVEHMEQFAAVLLFEDLSESVAILARLLQLRTLPLGRENVAPAPIEISADAMAAVAERNRLDIELYEHGRRLFERSRGQYPLTA